ncbi:MAG: 3-isopropylmalate dehydrogenase [Acidimicrobiia bacterium]|nr:MAG: 3-isopropylmalate dehydrogenase [Acidimicrobiia bacterium]
MRIAVVGGDGTGPEVVAEAKKVLDAAAERFGLALDYVAMDLSGSRYLATGEILTDGDLERLRSADAILFGAIGHPEVPPGVLERGLLLRIRGELDQYINLRPIKLYPGVASPVAGLGPEDVDMVVVRENSEGLYAGSGRVEGEGTPGELAIQESVNTRSAIDRCVRYAFELAKRRPRRLVTLVGKTNVLTYAWGLWERVTDDIATEYPEVDLDYAHVDAACLWLVEDPGRFDVIVTDNMFGDIITDLGAAIQGGLGIASGGNINPEGVSMFEPIGGTAPGFEGTGTINPLAAIGAAAMLLTELGETEAAEAVERAVAEVAGSLPSLRAGEMGLTTSGVGDRVASLVAG